MKKTIATCAALAVLGGCGGGAAFQNLFPDNKPEHIDLVLESVGAPEKAGGPVNSTGKPVVAAVLDEGRSLVLYDLEAGKALWKAEMAVDSAPAIGPDIIMVRSGHEIVALGTSDGKKRWSKKLSEENLYGFAFGPGTVFVTQGNTEGGPPATGRRGTIWALDAKSGGKRWEIAADKMLGGPAARGGLVFVPWDRQTISILDGATGAERCRVLRRDGMVDFVDAEPEGVFYGSKSEILRLTPRSAGGTKDGAAHLDFDPSAMPGQPTLNADTFESAKSVIGAKARIRLMWSPAVETAEDKLAIDSDLIYFLYYKYVIALGASDGKVRWVYSSPAPIAWATAGRGGVFFLEEDGQAGFLDAKTGLTARLGSLGGKPESGAIDTGTFVPPTEGEPRKLIWGLRDLVFDVDTQVVPLRKYALELMNQLPEEDVTMDLLEVLRSSSVPKAMRDQAALLLRQREGGVQFLMDALKYHADFLEGMAGPPVGAIATSLANAGEKKALPLLLDHLNDPETTVGDLVELTQAILVLGDESTVPYLSQFLVMYHADSSLATNLDVLVNVAEGLVKFGGDDGKAVIEEVIADPFTGSVLKEKLAEVVK